VLCQQNPLCDGVIVSKGLEHTECFQRAWVDPSKCVESEALDLWTLGAAAKSPANPEPPPSGEGLDRLVGVIDMVRQDGFQDLDLRSCALVGSAGSLLGQGAGVEIDSHTAVIRVNRLPTESFHADFGMRTDFLFLSKEWSGGGKVALMGGGEPEVVECHDANGCDVAAIIVRSDLEPCNTGRMKEAWGPTHTLVGCQHANISRMVSLGFSSLHGMLASTGLQAFFTFLPVCGELILYGFGGLDVADGHPMQHDSIDLYDEHVIEGMAADGKWDEIPWRTQFLEFEWMRSNAARVDRRFSYA